jgi:tripartite-type tricarboxylate transporter receptor subunit TctC
VSVFSLCVRFAMLALFLLCAASTHAQDYPVKPIRFLVPFPPGGATDAFARIMGQKMADTWGQQIVIDNRPGAGGNLAAELTLKSPADGYTIIIVGMSHAVNISIYSKLNYDPVRDFAGITQVASVETFLAVHPSLPVKTVKELVALAKARPGELNYGSGGSGAPGHLAMELLKLKARINLIHVPYKGALSMGGLVKGDHTVEFNNLTTMGAYITAGKVRVIAVGSPQRSSLMPQVPTIAESGVPGYDMVQWFGVLAPAGTSKSVISKIHNEMARILKLPEVQERMHVQGAQPVGNRPEEFDALIRSEITKWADIAKQAGIHAE